jgi:hypothetical protein
VSGAGAGVVSVGGLLPRDLLDRVTTGDGSLPGMDPTDYGLVPGERLTDAITRSWNRLQGVWEAFQRAEANLPDSDATATALTRDRWLRPLFDELGFAGLPVARGLSLDGKDYPISHQWGGTVPVHLPGVRVPVDRVSRGVPGAARTSPHGLVQEFLNRSESHLWGIVSNGRVLRILRNNASLTRQAFVEFDLEAMLDSEAYSDFVLLWLCCHRSRFEGEPAEKCLLEQWMNEAATAGTRALDKLREGVEAAINSLGQGFVAHHANADLREALRSGALSAEELQRQLLRLVYRLLFLLVAESRDLLLDPKADQTARQRYHSFYSMERLRTLAARRRGSPHDDLWASLDVTMTALGSKGAPVIGIAPLGSFLWSPKAIAALAGSRIDNRHLLAAVRHLCWVRDDEAKVDRMVDYRSLGAEELGSVYESLLELHAWVDIEARSFETETVAGSERKTTGSYYTPTSLIQVLLDSALDPVLDEAERATDPESALLGLKVLDPATGSGHFLIAAAHRIAGRLASIRAGGGEPAPEDLRRALREVVARCIYGIDVNPMAVELCKVSLWMEAQEPGRPLSFLDHRIVCGNAILGATPQMLTTPLAESAFDAIEGDDKTTATTRRKENRRQRRAGVAAQLSFEDHITPDGAAAETLAALTTTSDDTLDDVRAKEELWRTYQQTEAVRAAHHYADAWCAGFVARKTADSPEILCTTVQWYGDDPSSVPPATCREIEDLATHYRFLHPHLAFPDVFTVPRDLANATVPEAGWSGGFDVVLGNPPWDTLSPDAKEFFAPYNPQVRFMKKREQEDAFDELLKDPAIALRWQEYRRDLFATVHLIKKSGRYRLFAPGNLGKGDFNVYRMFVETALLLASRHGSVAQITPSGLYNGANAQAIRSELFERWDLHTLIGFLNTAKFWFPAIHSETRFAIYSARRGGPTRNLRVGFGVTSPTELADVLSNPQQLDVETVRRQSPKAFAISETVGSIDAEITDYLYRQWPAFGERIMGSPIRSYQREIDMGNDRDLFGDREHGLPLYEGRMISQYDHRAKAYRSGRGRSAVWDDLPFGSPHKAIVPQWRVPERNIPSKVRDRVWCYRVAFCDVTSPQAERSLVASLVPPGVICGDTAPNITFEPENEWAYLPWLAAANSLCVDFLARKKVSLHMKWFIMDSLPIARLRLGDGLLDRLAPLVLRLTCTAPEMTPYWNAITVHGWVLPVSKGTVSPDALLDDEARASVRAEIDAIVAKHLYGLERSQLEYIIDTFPLLERNETQSHGEFRTRRLVLEWFDKV